MVEKSILYIGNNKMNQFVLKQAIGKDYNIIMLGSYMEAVSKTSALIGRVSAVICCDEQFSNEMRVYGDDFVTKKYSETVPLIAMLPREIVEDHASAVYLSGYNEIIEMPYDPTYLRTKMKAVTEIYEKAKTESGGDSKDLEKRTKQLITVLSNCFTLIQFESADHIIRSKDLTHIIAETFADMYPEYGISQQDADYIGDAAALHDIGKALIPPSILFKAGKLTDDEFITMKQHTVKGVELLNRFGLDNSHKFFTYAFEIAKYHHERWDGKGYPDHLEGDQIPISAQIYSIIDVYNALIAERVYKSAIPYDQALSMIREGKTGVFPPKVLSAFNECESKMRAYLERSLNMKIETSGTVVTGS
ncbi:HD domain-containing phosphohydrolase [Ruminococcus sp. NK3A76]|uniref:HD-GYP domain-containing protein n=1 Tax=Ruminococcus sp. NK3A76 TaxID=877411 RepID=UPI00068C478F|nr:HD domain-containing phosphohydrolase [Ruminococcus sp. NK3A76]